MFRKEEGNKGCGQKIYEVFDSPRLCGESRWLLFVCSISASLQEGLMREISVSNFGDLFQLEA